MNEIFGKDTTKMYVMMNFNPTTSKYINLRREIILGTNVNLISKHYHLSLLNLYLNQGNRKFVGIFSDGINNGLNKAIINLINIFIIEQGCYIKSEKGNYSMLNGKNNDKKFFAKNYVLKSHHNISIKELIRGFRDAVYGCILETLKKKCNDKTSSMFYINKHTNDVNGQTFYIFYYQQTAIFAVPDYYYDDVFVPHVSILEIHEIQRHNSGLYEIIQNQSDDKIKNILVGKMSHRNLPDISEIKLNTVETITFSRNNPHLNSQIRNEIIYNINGTRT